MLGFLLPYITLLIFVDKELILKLQKNSVP